MEYDQVGIANEDEARELLEGQGLRLKDAQIAIAKTLSGDWRIVHRDDPARFITRCTNVFLQSVYIDYSEEPDDKFRVNNAYAHKLELKRYAPGGYDPEAVPGIETEWLCIDCGVPILRVDNVQMTFDGIDFPPIVGWRCPGCGNEMIPLDVYEEKLKPSEAILEAK